MGHVLTYYGHCISDAVLKYLIVHPVVCKVTSDGERSRCSLVQGVFKLIIIILGVWLTMTNTAGSESDD